MAKLDYVKEAVVKRNPNDAEFIQAVDVTGKSRR